MTAGQGLLYLLLGREGVWDGTGRSDKWFCGARPELRSKANGPRIATRPVGIGAGGRNRTRDPLITSQVLYQLSYTGEGLEL